MNKEFFNLKRLVSEIVNTFWYSKENGFNFFKKLLKVMIFLKIMEGIRIMSFEGSIKPFIDACAN